MDLLKTLNRRFSTKEFIPNRELTAEQIDMLENLLQLSPSSTNAQPWHFILATTKEGKERIAKSADGTYKFNKSKVLDASAVVIFCGRHDVDETFLLEVLEKEDKDGRFAEEQFKKDMHAGRSFFVNKHRYELKDIEHWAEKQVYLNLGQFSDFVVLGGGSNLISLGGGDDTVRLESDSSWAPGFFAKNTTSSLQVGTTK